MQGGDFLSVRPSGEITLRFRSVAVHVVVPVVVVLEVGVPLQGGWAVRACVEDVCCRCARGAKRDGFAGADEMASSENSLPMAGAAKVRAVFCLHVGGGSCPLPSQAMRQSQNRWANVSVASSLLFVCHFGIRPGFAQFAAAQDWDAWMTGCLHGRGMFDYHV